MTRQTFLALLLVILATGTFLRTAWLTADPPAAIGSVGIVWHDEGAWVHNARNRALWGVWRTDNWNPVFVAPVFTALEYGSFSLFGVGTWQARVVPVASGLAAIVFLVAGLNALAGRRAALIGGLLLSVNYVFVMWNRAALMESTMTAMMVVAWSAYAMAERRPWWGAVAGVAAILAWFTKAAAAFFVAALAIDAVVMMVSSRMAAKGGLKPASAFVLAGMAIAGLAIAALFVLPYWTEYQRYNWEMSVARKPSYGISDFLDRATWLPIVQGLFTRMWLVLAAAAIAIVAIVARWRTARPAERLLVLWVVLGLVELIIHDAGNERRYVMFVPAFVALAALLLGSRTPLLPADAAPAARPSFVVVPVLLLLSYVLVGSVVRLAFVDDVLAGELRLAVRASAALAVAITALVVWRWRQIVGLLSRAVVPGRVVTACLVIAIGWNALEYASWAFRHDDLNYRASIEVGRLLPSGTLVHGKLANGLALENQIRPVFIGNGFGNYEDRLRRDDVRYILTYVLPELGYESQHLSGLIKELLDRYPNKRVVAEFDVDETPAIDRAALIDKLPSSHARD